MAKYDGMNAKNLDCATDKARKADPITKAPGPHPVGTGTGADPVGTIAGAAVDGLGGKGIPEKIDPSIEDAYWRENHNRQAFAKDSRYDDYAPAYRVGH
ncbi:MAG: hypothetical protein ABI222_10555 [Opitutaceae bacterium]